MPNAQITSLLRTGSLAAVLATGALVAVAPRLVADDRDLVRASAEAPYVMMVLDTTGSMNWVPSADTLPVWHGDGPESRGYIIKSAVFEVIQGLDQNARVGFAHFAKPEAAVHDKRWLYRTASANNTGLPWWNSLPFPQPGQGVTFGGDPSTQGNCQGGVPVAQLYNGFKLGRNNTATTIIHADFGGAIFKVTFKGKGVGQQLERNLRVEVKVERCFGANLGEREIEFVPYFVEDDAARSFASAEWLPWDGSYQSQSNPCSGSGSLGDNLGLDDNSGARDGELAYTTYQDPDNRTANGQRPFDRGDFLPWDWRRFPNAKGFELSNRDELLRRLAPNIVGSDGQIDPTVVPDFRVAPYFEDKRQGNVLPLRSRYRDTPPFIFSHLTPIAGVLADLRVWYQAWKKVADEESGGALACRRRYVVLLTDGEDTCNQGDPAVRARELREAGVRTLVVGFGRGLAGSQQLQNIADQGGTGEHQTWDPPDGQKDCEHFEWRALEGGQWVEKNLCPGPVPATNKQQLIDALNGILSSLRSDSTAVAGVSVPLPEGSAGDSLYLPSFVALTSTPHWLGELHSFRRPLPLKQDDNNSFVPDDSVVCSESRKRGCLAWEANEATLTQTPTWDDVLLYDNWKIGDDVGKRRVFWARVPQGDNVPLRRAPLLPQTGTSGDELLRKLEFWDALGIDYVALGEAEAAKIAEATVAAALVPRQAQDAEGVERRFIVGDLFHSRPRFVGAPERYEYLASNLYGTDLECVINGQPNTQNRGYRCFYERQKYRRHMVVAGSNDGQVHAWDAGQYDWQGSGKNFKGEFTLGSGRELFAVVPGDQMAKLEPRARATDHDWGSDGEMVSDDVFIDPAHTGVPNPAEREWRTVAIGGQREGGRSYLALDVTQPDPVSVVAGTRDFAPPSASGASYVPKCSALDQPLGEGCGPLPYPAVRWQFTDDDLGFTWSVPNTGRVRVCTTTTCNQLEDRYVAIFGGGLDPEDDERGNHLYMVDIETGRLLYKRALEGAVPSEPAAVDTNGDGIIDRIYIGTVAGRLYKVDLTIPGRLEVPAGGGAPRVRDEDWQPFSLFSTADRAGQPSRPIYYPPSVIWVGRRAAYAIAFGTGDREDLWREQQPEDGRFYVVLDPNFTADTVPAGGFTAEALETIDAANDPSGDTVLYDATLGSGSIEGYALLMAEGERQISRPFALSGLLVFTTYNPDATVGDDQCSQGGSSNLYTLLTTSGNALPARDRFRGVGGFVSDPYSEVSAPADGSSSGTPTDALAPEDIERLEEVMRNQLPGSCKFSNSRINIKALRSDTGIEWLVPVPVCIQQTNWKQWS